MDAVWPQIDLFLRNPWDFIKNYQSSLINQEWKEREEKCRKLLIEIDKAILKKRDELKECYRREVQDPGRAEIFLELSAEVGAQLNALEKQKKTLEIDLEAFNRYEEHSKVVMEYSKALKGKLENISEEEKAKFIRELLEGIYIGKELIHVRYRFEKFMNG